MESSGDLGLAPAYPATAFSARLRADRSLASALGSVDQLVDAVVPGLALLAPGSTSAWMESGSKVRAFGWALAADHLPLGGVALAVGKAVFACRYGFARPDVARHYGRTEAARCGFQVDFDTADFAPGQYSTRLLGIDTAGKLLAVPAVLDLHFAALRPAGDFFAVPGSPSIELELTEAADTAAGDPREPTIVTQGEAVVIRGKAYDEAARSPFEDVAVIVGDDEVRRGLRTGGPASSTFEIVVPTAGRSAGMLDARVVALRASGRAELPFPPHLVVPAPPAAFVGLRQLYSPLFIQARARPCRLAGGRIDTDRFEIEGYAYDPVQARALRALALRVRLAADRYYPSGTILWAVYGLQRTDETATNAPASLQKTRFKLTLDRRSFGPGEYTVEALAPTWDLRGYLAPQPVTSFYVAGPPAARTVRTLVRVVRASGR